MKTNLSNFALILVSFSSIVLALAWALDTKLIGVWDRLEPLVFLVGLVVTLIISIVPQVFLKKNESKILMIYSYKNRDQALEIYKSLKKGQINILIDDDFISIGDMMEPKIESAINTASSFLFIIPDNINNSEWVNFELQLALKSKKGIIPILLNKNSVIPDSLKNIKYLDLSNLEQNKKIQYLLSVLKNKDKNLQMV